MAYQIVILQVLLLAFLAWGAFLCLARQDRRREPDRRRTPRLGCAGRRIVDPGRIEEKQFLALRPIGDHL
jgi:hypothetical protein